MIRINIKPNKSTSLSIILLFSLLFIIQSAYTNKHNSSSANKSITIKWYKSYPLQTFDNVKTGMLWSFSYLGANLPKGFWSDALEQIDSTTYILHINALGFNSQAESALALICDSIKNTNEYKQSNFIDISRLLVLTLHTPYHYYKITGVYPTLKDFNKRYHVDKGLTFGVNQSCVAIGKRIIQFSTGENIRDVAFYAIEGFDTTTISLTTGNTYEAMDILENGQLRFAIYDNFGNLTTHSPKEYGEAGKPSKCLWCHESIIQPLYTTNTAINGMLSNEDFLAYQQRFQKKLDDYRRTLNSELDYTKTRDHTYNELLYITFMEPNKDRLQQELKGKNEKVWETISKFETHEFEEFPFIGKQLYHRSYIDSLLNIHALRVPLSIREKVGDDPSFFK
ncbi:MAG: hypothetical protein J0M08_09625 [Bacteroidetes bacterium]|nr:hypothetical protein [Bacteroidota bacterium]